MKEIFKMDWFVDAFKNNIIDYALSNTGKKKGTAVLPTGAGKSGLIYANIVKHILDAKNNEKFIFNISAPILKLEAQLLNDFISIVKEIFPDRIERGEFMFFINSSADGNTYDVDELNSDVIRFDQIGLFEQDANAKFAIVASCHKSLYKFAQQIDYLNSFATVATYLDEAHLVVNETRRDDLDYSALGEDGKKRWRSLEEICKGEYVYALTATPDKYVTSVINKSTGEKDLDKHIIDIPARDLIKDNKILPVMTWVQRVSDAEGEKITGEICSRFMEAVIEDNPIINHKVLVTCSSTSHLEHLRDELGKSGYKVFSTCARDGGRYTEEDDYIDIDEVEFIKEVDEYNDNCFVLHIKQLRQGIDIKTLTDGIFYNSTRVNDGVKRTIIQTIGRILRPAKGERGKIDSERTKKYGNMLFLIGDNDYDTVVNQMIGFLLKYYGRDEIKAFTNNIQKDYGNTGKIKLFGNGNSHFGDDYGNFFNSLVEKLLVDMEDYIKKNILPRHNAFVKLNGGIPNKKLLPMAVESMKKKFAHYKGEYDTNELLSDVEFMKAVSDLFEKYHID